MSAPKEGERARFILDTVERLRPFLDYHRMAENSTRWTCPECQFESNRFGASHHRDCSHYRAASVLANPPDSS